ncbi:MAG: patatin-like phospholipase family protein [Pirellulaceae bacterium]|nr:patatin-like phospholipase family protein [Pirellulaceae bacterium]
MSADTNPLKPWLLDLPHPARAACQKPAGQEQKAEHKQEAEQEQPNQEPGEHVTALPPDTLGLALSGGGIRSAAFCLGVLQSLARHGWLRRVDYLSTVSGGGYTGAFLGRFFDALWKSANDGGRQLAPQDGSVQTHVARQLTDYRSAELDWLRRNSNYLAPTGMGEVLFNVATFWRNFLSVHLVLVAIFFAILGVMNALGYARWGAATPVAAVRELLLVLTPVTGMLPAPWPGALSMLTELTFWLALAPLMVAYWLVSEDRYESFVVPILAAVALVAAALMLGAFQPLGIAVLAAAIVWSLAAWAAIRSGEGRGHPASRFRLALARNLLTRWLGFWLAMLLSLAALALVDGLGRFLAHQMLEGGLTTENVVRWFGGLGAALLALAPILRMVASFFAVRSPDESKSLAARLARIPLLPTVLVLLLGAVLPLAALSFGCHVAYGVGYDWQAGLAATGLAVAVCLLLGRPECVTFVNRSGLLTVYSARLSRAFMGAVNPMRRLHPEGLNVAHVVAGDDLPFDEYKPHEGGGPLHLINCAVNETIDVASDRGARDRRAENLAVGPAGINLSRTWHARWAATAGGRPALEPLGAANELHPLLGQQPGPVPVERLNVREWIAISGAAVSPGSGRGTRTALAMLYTLANLRTGYWWNSGLSAAERKNYPGSRNLYHRLVHRLENWLRAQTLLLSELGAQFSGPWGRYWYLSDGGFFEVTGAYELLRRRCPFVVLCDAGADPRHEAGDLGVLMRLARIDFGAEFQIVSGDTMELGQWGVPDRVARQLGTLSDLAPRDGSPVKRHALLLSVRYPAADKAEDDPWQGRDHTWLLYLKATCAGDEPADIRNYRAEHPAFPNESTVDQFFDEPQWESYRKLGEHIGDKLFP